MLDINWILVISTAHNSISVESVYVEAHSGHLDSSSTASGPVQISGLGNNSANNSIYRLSSNSTRNPILVVSSYVQTIKHNMDSFELHYAQHGLL